MNELFFIVVAQICLESLPISSSGHMMLVSMLCQVVNGYSLELPKHFDHFLHGPTLVVLGVFFFSSWWLMARAIIKSVVCWLRGQIIRDSHRSTCALFIRIIAWVMCADVMTVALYGVGKLLNKIGFIIPRHILLLLGFCVTMLLLMALRLYEQKKNRFDQIYFQHAFILGLVQGLALIPGISRFASTFVVARFLGYSPRRSFATSFALFAPLVIAGFLCNGIRELIVHPEWLKLFTPSLIITMIGATVVAYWLFYFSYCLVLTRRLWWFGVYMFAPICLLVWLML